MEALLRILGDLLAVRSPQRKYIDFYSGVINSDCIDFYARRAVIRGLAKGRNKSKSPMKIGLEY